MTSDYNLHRLFSWNKDNILFNDNTNKYTNIYLHTGTYNPNHFEWQNSLCFTSKDSYLKLISNSNYFLSNIDYGCNSVPYIYNQIIKNYYETLDYYNNLHNISRNILDISKTYFYMIDSFVFSHSGHNLSVLLDQVQYIINNNIKDILILSNSRSTDNFKLIELLLPSDCIFYELEFNKIYEISNIVIIYPEFYYIYKHVNVIDNLRNIIYNKYINNYTDCINKNILLIKTNRYIKTNPITGIGHIQCDNLLSYFESRGWIYIDIGNIDIFQLCIYLLTAKNIICSDGSIVYSNKIFFNKDSNIFNLKHVSRGNDNFLLLEDFKKYYYITFNNYNLDDYSEYKKIINIVNSTSSLYHILDNSRLHHVDGIETYIDKNKPYGSCIENFEEALELCRYNDTCKQIVYYKNYKNCYPMTSVHNINVNNNDNEWISAYKYNFSNNIVFNNLSSFHILDNTRLSYIEGCETYIEINRPYGSSVETFEEVLEICKYNQNCKQIVYNKKNKTCYPMTIFTNIVPFYNNNENDWISAYRYYTEDNILTSFYILDNTRLMHKDGVETHIDSNRCYASYVETFEEAAEVCKYNENCKQIVYNKINKICYPMTYFYNITNTDDNDWISAYRYEILK